MGKDVFDPILEGYAEEVSSRSAEYTAELLRSRSDRGRVNDRQHLFDVGDKKPVKERLIRVLKIPKEHIPFQVAGQITNRDETPLNLLVECRNVRRQQTMQIELQTLPVGESGPLV